MNNHFWQDIGTLPGGYYVPCISQGLRIFLTILCQHQRLYLTYEKDLVSPKFIGCHLESQNHLCGLVFGEYTGQ